MSETGVYRAAHENAAVARRDDLAFVRVHGRDPVRMIQGLVTNDVDSLAPGDATYAALLTPKGRMLADLRVIRRQDDLLLVCHRAALPNVVETLRKYVPPLFARAEDPGLAAIGVYGPAAPAILPALLDAAPALETRTGTPARPAASPVRPIHAVAATPADPVEPAATAITLGDAIPALAEDHGILAGYGGSPVHVVRDGDAGLPGYLIIGLPAVLDPLEADLSASTTAMDGETLEVLRVEAGRPRWGAELSESVFPLEAGLQQRAISTAKGCYTGQEVIVRILHRGHVNWRLAGVRLGTLPPPDAGTQLFRPGDARAVARLTSSIRSPRAGETVALALVRREIEPGDSLAVGGPDGPPATIVNPPFGASPR